MHENVLKDLLLSVQNAEISLDEAVEKLRLLPFEDIGFAKIDHHRPLLKGFPEVIWGEGKTREQTAVLIDKIGAEEKTVLATRVAPETGAYLAKKFPQGQYLAEPRLFIVEGTGSLPPTRGTVLVLSAGTSDIPVAEEAYHTARVMGNEVQKIYDVGVAGLHRLMGHIEDIRRASVIIVVAGMEGALSSVVGGLAGRPVIAVPTSVGYGVSLKGLTTLFAMLSSCSSGVTVVNINNGFGAAYAASLMNRS